MNRIDLKWNLIAVLLGLGCIAANGWPVGQGILAVLAVAAVARGEIERRHRRRAARDRQERMRYAAFQRADSYYRDLDLEDRGWVPADGRTIPAPGHYGRDGPLRVVGTGRDGATSGKRSDTSAPRG